MKWGRKARDENEKSSTLSLLSDVFSFSWFSRRKRAEKNRLQPPVGSDRVVVADAPRRRSTGDDEGRRQMILIRERSDTTRSARHYSLGEIELRPLSGCQKWVMEPPRGLEVRSPPPLEPRRIETRRRGQRMRARVKVCSPRAGRRRAGEEERGEKRGLESFAVVKRSSDPQKDFRDSMVEMIREKGMERPEELERLLACYITLNSDEHHDVIVKAFRQVWFDLNPARIAAGQR